MPLQEYPMPSCRVCGGELRQVAICPTCEENVQWKCISCNKETDRSIHVHDSRIVAAKTIGITADESFETESPAASSRPSSATVTM